MDLSAIDGYSDPEPVAARLIESFDSLPWTYQVAFELPEQLSGLLPAKLDSYPLSPTVRIVRATETFNQEFPLTTEHPSRQRRMRPLGGGLLSAFFDPPVWSTKNLYLQVL